MSKLYPAKFITIIYFSIVSLAIVAIHFSVYEFTLGDLEHLYANNRLEKIKEYSTEYLADKNLNSKTSIELQTQGKADFDKNIKIYFDFSKIPQGFPSPNDLSYNEVEELKSGPNNQAYFVSKTKLELTPKPVDAYFIVDNSLYELSERQLFSLHIEQVLISIALLIVSLIAVVKISGKLTAPITNLAKLLSVRSSNDFSPLPMPTGVTTVELAKLIETFNHYQTKINNSIERERSFNRYASHELRSPLMVMNGAITLLEEADTPESHHKQCQRLRKAATEMNEFIETLLSLTKSINVDEYQTRSVTEDEVIAMIKNHDFLLDGKSVTWNLTITPDMSINMPEPAFHILLGNIIKNAFAYTQEGQVDIKLAPHKIEVIDTGMGANAEKHCDQYEGYGLGLLLVQDICHRYGWKFSLNNNSNNGCIAQVTFNQKDTP